MNHDAFIVTDERNILGANKGFMLRQSDMAVR
jgi:hypothetical protein